MILGNPVVAIALEDRLLQHVTMMRIKDACFPARDAADLIPEQFLTLARTSPPTPKRGQPKLNPKPGTIEPARHQTQIG